MGRKKIASTEKSVPFKNVLAQLFGTYIRKQRVNEKLGYEEMSQKVGVSGSFYRHLESGGTVFNPTRAYTLMEIFPTIEWEPLVKLLLASQMLDAGMSSWKELQILARRISEKDPQLKKLIEKLSPIWKLDPVKNEKEINGIIESNELLNELDEYLRFNKYYLLSDEQQWNQRINDAVNDTPSLYFDFALNSLEQLQKLPIRVIQEDMHNWETQNENNFAEMFAIITNDSLTLKPNLDKYRYNYLLTKEFRKLTFIIVNDSLDPKIVKKKFLDGLIEFAEHDQNDVERFSSIIHFKKAAGKNKTEVENLLTLKDEKTNNTQQFKNLWIWQMTNGRFVGFCSNADENTISSNNEFQRIPIINLTLKQIEKCRLTLAEYLT